MERVIVAIKEGYIPSIYDFLRLGETDEHAEERAFFRSMEKIRSYMNNHENFPSIQEDGSEYWEEMANKEDGTDYKVMSYEDFQKIEKEAIVALPLEDSNEEEFQNMLEILPPRAWTTHNEVEMFCMSEFYTGAFTTQYAHDHRTGKYYKKLVDFRDKATWICEILRKGENK